MHVHSIRQGPRSNFEMGGEGGGPLVTRYRSLSVSSNKRFMNYGMQSSLHITRDKYYTCINDWFVKVALFT